MMEARNHLRGRGPHHRVDSAVDRDARGLGHAAGFLQGRANGVHGVKRLAADRGPRGGRVARATVVGAGASFPRASQVPKISSIVVTLSKFVEMWLGA